MSVEIPDTRAVRWWLRERAEVPPGRARPANPAHIADFGPSGVAVAGRDHAYRSPEDAIREGAELILAGLLLEEHAEQVLAEVADVERRRLEGYARSAAEYVELLGDVKERLDEGKPDLALRLVEAALQGPERETDAPTHEEVYRDANPGFECRDCCKSAPCSWQIVHADDCEFKRYQGETLERA